jgi:hypothetical protein
MSKKRSRVTTTGVREMRAEYRFDYAKARPNPYAARLGKDAVIVALDPDVAAVFRTAESVNDLLRSVIAALPHQPKRRSRKTAS